MRYFLVFCVMLVVSAAGAQDTLRLKNQYGVAPANISVTYNAVPIPERVKGNYVMPVDRAGSVIVSGAHYDSTTIAVASVSSMTPVVVNKNFSWSDLLQPMFYIANGGIWLIIFIVFAETGLFAGFFLPGDSLLFVTGIYSDNIAHAAFGLDESSSLWNLLIIGFLISVAGILGNFLGYWFGRKSGPFLFERKDSFLFKKKYLFQARDLFDKHGGAAIIVARFVPIIRTFAPIVAGIVAMDRKKFSYYTIVGSFLWVYSLTFAGHYLQRIIMNLFQFDLREHLEVIVLGIVLVTTTPVLWKLFFSKSKSAAPNDQSVH